MSQPSIVSDAEVILDHYPTPLKGSDVIDRRLMTRRNSYFPRVEKLQTIYSSFIIW